MLRFLRAIIRFLQSFFIAYREYLLFAVLLVLSLFLMTKSEKEETKNFRAVVFGFFASTGNVLSDIITISNVRAENERLRKKNAQLMLEVQRLRNAGRVNEDLNKMLGFKDTTSLELTTAKIISKDLTNMQMTITIDAGENQSLRPGMAVITADGLVGIVDNVSRENSVVRALQNKQMRIVAKDQRSRFNGIIRWNGEYVTMTNLPKTADIQIGDTVMTSEISSIFGVPLPIGTVESFLNPEQGLFNDLVIAPFVSFAKMEYVFVVKSIPQKKVREFELNFYNEQ